MIGYSAKGGVLEKLEYIVDIILATLPNSAEPNELESLDKICNIECEYSGILIGIQDGQVAGAHSSDSTITSVLHKERRGEGSYT